MKSFILSGGSGTRMWPVSRQKLPKQFCEVFDKSLFEKTTERLAPLGALGVITTESLKTLTRQVTKKFDVSADDEIYEPFGCNTAPAIALLCHIHVQRELTEEVVGIFPADQLIQKTKPFQDSVRFAEEVAKKGQIVTLGVQPHFPATGYGYIEVKEINHEGELAKSYGVSSFHEKPNPTKAREYIDRGNFFWNAGIFIFRITDMATYFEKYQPKMWSEISQVKADLSNLREIYQTLEKISIDYAIIEKLSPTEISCVPTDMGWSDVGSWDAIAEIAEAHLDERPSPAKTEEVQSSKNYVFPFRDKTYAFYKVDDLIVVDTADVTLITPRGEAEGLREVVKHLENKNSEKLTDHTFEHRPWGKYEILRDTEDFKSKVITVEPQAQLSYQSHTQREEHWIVTRGEGEVILNDQTIPVHKGSYIHIPTKAKHRMRNTSDQPLVFVEVQLGAYFGEDDIQRHEDDYERC